ncbi:MAG: vanadium-dependent haloperoxidase [Pseudomonadota bacterium]
MTLDRKATRPVPDGLPRIDEATERRHAMAELAGNRPLRKVYSNEEELTYGAGQPSNFTKGLPHDAFGLVDRAEYTAFVNDLSQGNPKMDGATKVPGRNWESPLAGHYFEIEGPDPAQFTMAPAPKMGGSELCFEMASVYVMALLRDVPFVHLSDPAFATPLTYPEGHLKAGTTATMQDIVDELRKLSWADPDRKTFGFRPAGLTAHEKRRRAALWDQDTGKLEVSTLFRGSTAGSKSGPYLSQFLLLGTRDRAGNTGNITDGVITYGAQTIDQRVAQNTPGNDFMCNWQDWLDVQNAADAQFGAVDWTGDDVLMATPRDLATYVHFDQLYQAYLNAGMMMDIQGAKVDEGTPIVQTRSSNSQGFATWGGPHMLSLVTEVATRALRAVRRQKFQIHRRARPEVMAARLTQVQAGATGSMDPAAVAKLQSMLAELGADDPTDDTRPGVLLYWINQCNGGSVTIDGTEHADANFLLPMAFAEGSPMHPAYGAGHATVAGACVTILKAFYDAGVKMKDLFGLDDYYQANAAGTGLDPAGPMPDDALASDELDKLAANISIGRNWAGVHYYTDYYDSIRLGERIAAGILQEQMLTYNEPVELSFRDFDGEMVEIKYDPDTSNTPELHYHGGGDWWLRPVEGFYQTHIAGY